MPSGPFEDRLRGPWFGKQLQLTARLVKFLFLPALSDQALVSHVLVEKIHGVVDCLHLLYHDGPAWKFLRNVVQNSLAMILSLVQNHIQILQASQYSLQHFFAFFDRTWTWIQICMVTGTHFANACFQLFTLEECNENGFVQFVTLK